MNVMDFLNGIPGVVTEYRFPVRDGVLKIGFTGDQLLPANLKQWRDLPLVELLQNLDKITHRVTMTIKAPETKNKDSQLTMSVADAMEIFGGEVPSDANFTRICRRFLDRKHHGPTPPPYEPAERSMGAQGQTKKPGSHSEGRHG